MALVARLTDIYGHPIDIDRPMTADEFLEIVDRLPYRAELIDGEVVVDAPSYRHQHVVGELFVRLRAWVRAAPRRGACGFDVDVQLDDGNIHRPDVWWYSEERKPSFDERNFNRLPDIAVEVLSPRNRRYDVGAKRTNYERLGLPELWLIDPDTYSAAMWRRSTAGYPAFDVFVKLDRPDIFESPQLPGFAVRLDDLFR
jgi:Uma2 family endonuclease